MQETIAEELGLSKPTVKRAVALLAGAKLLRIRRVKPKKGRRAVNHYALIHPASEVSPLIPHSGIILDP